MLATVSVSALLVGGARSASEASGLIAFARLDGVYVMRADGSGVRPLRRGGVASGAYGLAWSPDGSRLAFVAESAIWVMDVDGSDLVRLVAAGGAPGEAPGWLASPTWAPDGRRIAFTAGRRYGRDIWVMNADGSDKRRLARTPGYNEAEVDWSPRGGRVAFSGAGWVTCICVMNTNGSNLRILTPGWAWEAMPDWAPDGRRIVFTDGADISVMDAGGGSRWHLTRNKAIDSEPVWSPGGRRIAFVRADVFVKRDWNEPEPRRPDSSSEIYVMNADGTGVTRLTHNRVAEGSPTWQPVAPS